MRARAFLALACVVTIAASGCITGGTLLQSSGGPTGPVDQVLDKLGDVDVKFLDIVSSRFLETPSHLVVEIQVAGLDPTTLAGDLAKLGFSFGYIAACWDPEVDQRTPYQGGQECAGVELEPNKDAPLLAYYELGLGRDEGCNDWYWCTWAIPHEVVPGDPTTIRVRVPRELMPADEVGHEIESPYAIARAFKPDPMNPVNVVGRSLSVKACGPIGCYGPALRPMVVAKGDDTDVGADLTLAQPRAGTLGTPAPTTLVTDAVGEIRTAQGDRKDIDIVSVDIEETMTEVGFIVKVASLPDKPTHSFDMDLGVAGVVYEAWYNVVNGEVRDVGAGHCKDADCDTWVDHVPTVALHPGTPGTIRVAMPWDDLEGAPKGALVSLASVDLGEYAAYQAVHLPIGTVAAQSHGAVDTVWIAEPYYLTTGDGTTAG
jgi:hypothetical protein